MIRPIRVHERAARRVARALHGPAAAALIAFSAAVLAACQRGDDAAEVEAAERPVAVVDDDTITVGQTASYMRATRADRTHEGARRAVEDLIAVELVKVAARGEPLTPEQEALRETWREQLMIYQYRDSVLYKSIAVPDSAVEAYYREKVGDEVKARHVLVAVEPTATPQEKAAARARAEEALARARAGEDFEELAREYSSGTTAASGGELDWFGRGDMVPAFERAVFALDPGDISDVVETRFGYHVIRLEGKRKKSLEELRPSIEEALRAPKEREAVRAFEDSLMTGSGLEFLESNVDSLVAVFAADSVGRVPERLASLPVATWRVPGPDSGGKAGAAPRPDSLTIGTVVERFRGLPAENQAAVKALDRGRMVQALAPLVRNEMIVGRAEALGMELDEARQRQLDDRLESVRVTEMLRRRVRENVTVSDSALRAAWTADSTRFAGSSFEEATPALRQSVVQERLNRANSWEGQREMVLEIAETVRDDVDVERYEDGYEGVLELLGPPPDTSSVAGGGAAGAGAGQSPAGDAGAGLGEAPAGAAGAGTGQAPAAGDAAGPGPEGSGTP
ncbi:MAG TPA: peptidylprolyl isomerase [Gemmatimonadota bacterium]